MLSLLCRVGALLMGVLGRTWATLLGRLWAEVLGRYWAEVLDLGGEPVGSVDAGLMSVRELEE